MNTGVVDLVEVIGTRAALLPGRHTDSLRAWPCARPVLARAFGCSAGTGTAATASEFERPTERASERRTRESQRGRSKRMAQLAETDDDVPGSKPKLPPAFRAPCRPTTPAMPPL